MSDSITIIVKEKKKYDCNAWKNSIRFSPPPKYRALLRAMAEENEHRKVGNTLKHIVRDYFDRMPIDQQYRLLTRSKHHY